MCRLTDYCLTFTQCAKEVVSNSPGLVDFAIGLANSLLNFSAQLASEVFLGIQITEQLLSKSFFGLVHANYSMPEWQTSSFFAPSASQQQYFVFVLQFTFAQGRFYLSAK